jgi:hypothetical protein
MPPVQQIASLPLQCSNKCYTRGQEVFSPCYVSIPRFEKRQGECQVTLRSVYKSQYTAKHKNQPIRSYLNMMRTLFPGCSACSAPTAQFQYNRDGFDAALQEPVSFLTRTKTRSVAIYLACHVFVQSQKRDRPPGCTSCQAVVERILSH